MELLEHDWLGNTLGRWIVAFLLGIGSAIAFRVSTHIMVSRVSALAERTDTHWDDLLVAMLRATRTWFLMIVAVFVATLLLALPPSWEIAARRVTAVLAILQGGLWCAAGLTAWLENYRKVRMKDDPAAATTVTALGFMGKVLLWSLALLLALDNLGIDVTALVAGLGVGGVAVALAAQNILGDLFASMSIVLDKPFVIGDFIALGEFAGSIEYVGLKTTRVRSLSGEQLVFSNSDLLQSRIRNYGRLRERRIVFAVGVTYQTPREKLARIPMMLKEAVESQQSARFDRAHFKSFGPSSLDFEIVYFVQVPEYKVYMDVQQAINLDVVRRFEAEGIEFAYPTQTLYVVGSGQDLKSDPARAARSS